MLIRLRQRREGSTQPANHAPTTLLNSEQARLALACVALGAMGLKVLQTIRALRCKVLRRRRTAARPDVGGSAGYACAVPPPPDPCIIFSPPHRAPQKPAGASPGKAPQPQRPLVLDKHRPPAVPPLKGLKRAPSNTSSSGASGLIAASSARSDGGTAPRSVGGTPRAAWSAARRDQHAQLAAALQHIRDLEYRLDGVCR